MPKYKDYVNKMLSDHRKEFANFKKIHKLYEGDELKWQQKFNLEGEQVLEIVREYENRLCGNTERGKYNKFSSKLSEKFQKEVRKLFPMIDHVGIVVEKAQAFELKKIKLF